MRLLTIEDLTDTAKNLLEHDYQENPRRERCSREDFAAGWLANAKRQGRAFFQAEAWQEATA